MNPGVSVVITCYNPLPVMRQAIEAALATTGPETEFILVDNYSPYPEVRPYLERLARVPRVRVLDPGTNLGCHRGQRFGLLHATGTWVVKLDDDIVVPQGWHRAMARALHDHPVLAYLALPWEPVGMAAVARRGEAILEGMGYRVKVAAQPVLFGCVMLRRDLWQRHFSEEQPGLYGWEDVRVYPPIAQRLGKRFGYLISHPARHLTAAPEADPLYRIWKVLYVHAHPSTLRGDFGDWRHRFVPDPAARDILMRFGFRPEDVDRWLAGAR